MNQMTEEESVRRREVALSLAVQHHGMSNHSRHPNSYPAGTTAVVKTATQFEAYISNGEVPSSR